MSILKERIQEAVDSYRHDIVEFTKALIEIPTENPPGRAYGACAQVIANKLRSLGFEPEVRAVIPPDKGVGLEPSPSKSSENLSRYWVRSFQGEGRRTLYFHGHYDIVPASTGTQFEPALRHGNLFARGAADMKAGLAAMVYAAKLLKDLNIKLDGRIGLVFVPDEETGGALGSQALSEQGGLCNDGIGMLTPEPTGGVIWNASRGAISMRVTVKGKSAHVGLASCGVNAFERMLEVASSFVEYSKQLAARRTAFRVTPESARGSILLLGGRCEGGTNFNIVPSECSFTVDRRINPEEDFQTEKESLLGLLERFQRNGIDLETEIFQEGRSAGISESDPVAQALAESVEEITGCRPSFEMCPGLLEIRFYAEKGVPAFAYGPGLLSVSHGPNEFVALDNVFSCAAVYALAAVKLLGPKGA